MFSARVGSAGRRRVLLQQLEVESSVGGEWHGAVGHGASETQLLVAVETTAL